MYLYKLSKDEIRDNALLKCLGNHRFKYRYTVSNSSIGFQHDYFYHRQDGTYYTYKDGAFIRHDLISNFTAGDLLYGTEIERLKVRSVIEFKLEESSAFITPDVRAFPPSILQLRGSPNQYIHYNIRSPPEPLGTRS